MGSIINQNGAVKRKLLGFERSPQSLEMLYLIKSEKKRVKEYRQLHLIHFQLNMRIGSGHCDQMRLSGSLVAFLVCCRPCNPNIFECQCVEIFLNFYYIIPRRRENQKRLIFSVIKFLCSLRMNAFLQLEFQLGKR